MLYRRVDGEPEEYRLLRESLCSLLDVETTRRYKEEQKVKTDRIVEHMRSALRKEEALSMEQALPMEEALSIDGYHYLGKLKNGGNEVWEGDDDFMVLKPSGEWKRVPYYPMGTTYEDLEDA